MSGLVSLRYRGVITWITPFQNPRFERPDTCQCIYAWWSAFGRERLASELRRFHEEGSSQYINREVYLLQPDLWTSNEQTPEPPKPPEPRNWFINFTPEPQNPRFVFCNPRLWVWKPRLSAFCNFPNIEMRRDWLIPPFWPRWDLSNDYSFEQIREMKQKPKTSQQGKDMKSDR